MRNAAGPRTGGEMTAPMPPAERIAAAERTGHEIGEVRIGDRDESDDGQVPACRPSSRLEHQQHGDHAEREVEGGRLRDAVDHLLEIDEDVRGDRDRARRGYEIEERD